MGERLVNGIWTDKDTFFKDSAILYNAKIEDGSVIGTMRMGWIILKNVVRNILYSFNK